MKLLRGEEGRSLPFALVVVAVGALLVGPFLAHVSTSLLGSRAMQEGMNKQYACDAGVEFGIWKLVNDPAFTPGTPLTIVVNQFTTTIEVTSLSWDDTLPPAHENVRNGGALVYADGYIYAFRGDKQKEFWRYPISGGSWETLTNAPEKVGAGGALAYGGDGYIYAFRGDGNKDFWRYPVSGGSWETLTPAPDTVGDGGALAYGGDDYIYAFRGNNSPSFCRFSIGLATYDIMATADVVSIEARVAITGTDEVAIQSWETQ